LEINLNGKNQTIRTSYLFLIVFFLILSRASFCQVRSTLNFENCRNFEDSCLITGNQFVNDLKSREFSDLSGLFADKILFRALVPASIETSNAPEEIANTF